MHGGGSGCRRPLLGAVSGAEPLPWGAGKCGLGSPLQNRGLEAPATAVATPWWPSMPGGWRQGL